MTNVLREVHSGDYRVSDSPLTVQVYISDDISKNNIEAVFRSNSLVNGQCFVGDIRTAIDKFKNTESPDIVIVDISNLDMPVQFVEQLSAVCAPTTKAIVIGDQDSVGLYRELKHHDVSEYFVTPVPQAIFQRYFGQLLSPSTTKGHRSAKAKRVVISGTCGGVGTTSIAAALSDHISSELRRKTLLTDLNVGLGGQSLIFGLQEQSALSSFVKAPERIDPLFISRSLESISERLKLLAGDNNEVIGVNLSKDVLGTLFREVEDSYHFIISDVALPTLLNSSEVDSYFDVLVLIFSPNILSLRNGIKACEKLSADYPSLQVIPLLNHIRPIYETDLDVKMMAEKLHRAISFNLPYEGRLFSRSALSAETILRTNGRCAAEIRKLGAHLAGTQLPASQQPLLQRLVGGLNVWKEG